MASNWDFGGGSSGGSSSNWNFGGGHGRTSTATKSSGGGSGGLLGLAENLGSDVGNLVTSLPQGVVNLGSTLGYSLSHNYGSTSHAFRHPIWNIEQAWNDPKNLLGQIHQYANSEKQTYAPVIHGNFHRLYEHPLTPVLDAATALSLGGAGSVKLANAGLLGDRAAQLARGARVIQSGDLAEGLNQARTLQGRALQRRFDQYSMAHPDSPIVGVNPRLAKTSNARVFRRSEAYKIPARRFQQITNQLTKPEKFAMHIAAEGVPLSERIDFYKNILKDNPDQHIARYLNELQNPKVAEVLANPSDRLVKAVQGAKDLEAKAGQSLVDAGKITPEIRAERALLPQKTMRSTEPSLENAVHPAFPEPFRMWHTAEGEKASSFSPPVAPLGKVKDLGQVKKNEGIRLATARITTNPEVFTQDYLQTMRHQHQLDLQRDVLDKVKKPLDTAADGGKAADEWYYRPSVGRKTTEPIPREVKEQATLGQDIAATHTEAGLEKHAGETVFKQGDMPSELRNLSVEKLAEKGVYRIPAAYASRYQKEFATSSKVARLVIDRPLDVWRSITLNARPAWMVNNLVGNNLMYALRHPGGAGAYLRALASTERGEDKLLSLWKFTMRSPTVRRKYGRIFDEVAPEIHSSGLYGTQVKLTHKGIYDDPGTIRRVSRALGVPAKIITTPLKALGKGITALETHLAEDVPRDAAMLRETKAAVQKLKAAGLSTEDALKSLAPRDVELAVDRVNDFLGDFNAISPFERRIIRRFIPFEAWYRVIFTVSAKYAINYPARLKMIQLFENAQKQDNLNLPPWLAGSIPLGQSHGVNTVISTSGLNPYQTVPQVFTESPGSMLNPFAEAGVIGLTGVDPFTQGDYRGWGARKTGSPLADFLRRAPGSFAYGTVPGELATKLFAPPKSKVYAPHTYGHVGPVPINDALLQYLGLPIRHVKKQR